MDRCSFRLTAVAGAAVAALCVSLALLHAEVTPATQAAAVTQPVATDVDQLIKQLGSDDADDRDSAQKQLVEMGQQVAAKLKQAAENDEDPEIRSRASAALAQMKDSQDNGTSLITLHRKDATAQDALDAIGQQAHVHFLGFGAGGLAPRIAARTVTIDAEKKPFWDVMGEVCTQLNVCPTLDTPGRNAMRLFPVARNWISKSPHEVVGPYWVGVAGLYRARSIDLMGPASVDDQFSISLIVYPEPKLSVTQMSGLKLKEVTDDAGNSLLPKFGPAPDSADQ